VVAVPAILKPETVVESIKTEGSSVVTGIIPYDGKYFDLDSGEIRATVRFWAGSANCNAETAPFKVLADNTIIYNDPKIK